MPAPNKIDRERVKQLLRQGLTPKQIHLRLGVNKSSVSVIAAQVRKEAAQ
jgi:DNA-binding CsgD family transcriptional regulator